MGIQIDRDISLFCLIILLLWPSRPCGPPGPGERLLPHALLLFVLSEWGRKRIREGKIKRECLWTQRAVYPSQEVWERGRKKTHTSSEEGGGNSGIVPSFLTHCLCVYVCVCLRDCEREFRSKPVYSDRRKLTHLGPTTTNSRHTSVRALPHNCTQASRPALRRCLFTDYQLHCAE